MEQILAIVYVTIWLLLGWGFTTWMITRDFGRKIPFDSLSKELSLMIVWWVIFSIAGMFWPLLPVWWVIKRVRVWIRNQ